MRSSQGSRVTARQYWHMVVILAGLVLMPSLAPAQQGTWLTGAEEIIARADELGTKQNVDGAVALLKSAVERYPTYAPAYLALARWQQAKGTANPADVQALLDTCGLGILNLRDDREIRRRVHELVTAKFPVKLGPYGSLALPGCPAPFTFRVRDPRLYAFQRGIQQGMITTAPLDAGDAYRFDPKYHTAKYARDPVYGGWTFQRVLYAYVYDRVQQCWNLRFRVIWQHVPGTEDARLQLAQQTARLLVRLSGLLIAYTADPDLPAGFAPRFADDGAVNVWLTEKGDPGGEAYNENIYIYNVGTPRSAAEWVRELAHEFGHQVFKPVGGYEKPEWAASGLLGEALFLRWLAVNAETENEALPWLNAFDPGTQYNKRYLPLVRRFAEAGPVAPPLRGTDETAMEHFVGMALYLETARGSEYLTGTFNAMTVPAFAGTNGFLDALETMVELKVQAIDAPTVTLRLRDLPQDIPHYVFLRDGAWQGEFQGQGFQTGKVKLTIDGKETPLDLKGTFTITTTKPGWHQMRLKSTDAAGTLQLTSVKLAYGKK